MSAVENAHFRIRSLWLLEGPVGQLPYAVTGFTLMLLKYFCEAVTVYSLTGLTYTPLDFVNPLLSGREEIVNAGPAWLGLAWAIWTLPFIWTALAMTVRRAFDAGLSPWLGLLVLVPIVNLLWMLALVLIPSGIFSPQTDAETSETEELQAAYASPTEASDVAIRPDTGQPQPLKASDVGALLVGIGLGACYVVAVTLYNVYLLGDYGAALFFGAPVVTGAAAGFWLNRRSRRTTGATLLHGSATIFAACLAFLGFGIEGGICIVMALPVMIPPTLMGSLIGRAIATSLHRSGAYETRGMIGCLMILPLAAMIEAQYRPTETYATTTEIEIAAPIDTVWQEVIAFSEISAKPAWYFRMGVAYPQRARIEGHGVGATRYCEFSTGAFVEPITIWDEPVHLGFDVTDQPEPMFELTPYRHIHPPHLDHSFRSLRGEFRLRELESGRTLLTGTTWYQLDIRPVGYWQIWSDWIIHRIHKRVLFHIRDVSEQMQKSRPEIAD